MTDVDTLAYCHAGLHLRDTVTGECLECGDTTVEPLGSMPAPPRGAVVLTEGATGTAWQRHHLDGRWHSTTGKSTTWERLVRADKDDKRLRIIYLPPQVR